MDRPSIFLSILSFFLSILSSLRHFFDLYIFMHILTLQIKGLVLLGSIFCKTDSKIRPPTTFRGNGGKPDFTP